MGKQRRILLATLVLLLMALVAYYFAHPKEPAYNGRTLTEWLEPRNVPGTSLISQPNDESYKAVRAIGTNAVPILLKWVQAEDSGLILRANSLLDHQRLSRHRFKTADDYHLMASLGLGSLGTNALPAVPTLLKIVANTNSPTRSDAYTCLNLINDYSSPLLPVLLNHLSSTDSELAYGAAMILSDMYPKEAAQQNIYKKFPQLEPQEGAKIISNSPATTQ